MLPAHLTRVVSLALAALIATPVAWAGQAQEEAQITQSTKDFEKVGHLPKKDMPDMKYVPQYARPLYDNLNPQQLTPAQLQGLKDAQHILKSTPLVPKAVSTYMAQSWAQALGKKGAGIANAALAANRKAVLSFLGFKPQNADRLYYFVSFSMPLNLLREYALQAMWDGGILVLKGPLPNVQLSTFITKDLYKLVGGKGASATITIDPRLYDAFHVTAAPTIVYSTLPENRVCGKVHLAPLVTDHKKVTYPVCDPVNPKYYWKLEGAVTSEFALDQFKADKAPGVSQYLKALARGGRSLNNNSKVQPVFQGSWRDAPTPEQLQAIRQTVAKFGQSVYQTPYGIAVGPKMTIKPGQGIQALGTAGTKIIPNTPVTRAQVVTKQGQTYTAP